MGFTSIAFALLLQNSEMPLTLLCNVSSHYVLSVVLRSFNEVKGSDGEHRGVLLHESSHVQRTGLDLEGRLQGEDCGFLVALTAVPVLPRHGKSLLLATTANGLD